MRIGGSDRSALALHHDLRRSHLDLFADLRKVLLVPLVGGGELQWEVLDYPKSLNHFVQLSLGLQRVYRNALMQNPPSSHRPWSVCIAFDEFVPGNKLQATGQTSTLMP